MKQINAMTHLAYLQFEANAAIKQLLSWVHTFCLILAMRHILANTLDIINKSSGEVDESDPAKRLCCTFQRVYLLLCSEKTQSELTKACGCPAAREQSEREEVIELDKR